MCLFRERVRAYIRGFVLSECLASIELRVCGAPAGCTLEMEWRRDGGVRCVASSTEGEHELALEELLKFLSDDAGQYRKVLNQVCDWLLPLGVRPERTDELRQLDLRIDRLELFHPEQKCSEP